MIAQTVVSLNITNLGGKHFYHLYLGLVQNKKNVKAAIFYSSRPGLDFLNLVEKLYSMFAKK
jgi:hypothetical protein